MAAPQALTAQQLQELNGFSQNSSAGLGDRLLADEQAGVLHRIKWGGGGTAQYGVPAAASATSILAATATNASLITTLLTGFNQPDCPRVLAIKGGNTMTGNVVINGFAADGSVIQDTIALNSTTTVNGVKAFARISSIVLPANASAYTISIGVAAILGLDTTAFSALMWDAFVDTGSGPTHDLSSSTLAVSGVDVSLNLYTPNTAPNGANKYRIAFLNERD